jgi:DNA-cytosine methyltransferase
VILTVGGACSGIGGVEYAFTAAGFDVRWMIEIDPFCQQVLRKHWPHAEIYSDLLTVDASTLRPVDVFCAGFPCQPFSIAGNQLAEDDPRHLWPQLHKIIERLHPRVCLFENVPNLRNVSDGTTFRDILRSLAEIGYDAEWDHLRAEDTGSPQERERIFIVAHTKCFRDARQDAAEQPACDQKRNDSAHQQIGRPESGTDRADCQILVNADSGYERSCRTNGLGDGKQAQSFARSGQELEHAQINGFTPLNPVGSESRLVTKRFGGKSEELVNASGAGRGESDTARVTSDAGHTSGRPDAERRTEPHESDLGGDVDGLSSRLVGHRWPAGQGAFQYDHEPPRTVKEKLDWHNQKIGALGNAVVPQVIYPIALVIREYLESSIEPK